jgi:hypothetical protein
VLTTMGFADLQDLALIICGGPQFQFLQCSPEPLMGGLYRSINLHHCRGGSLARSRGWLSSRRESGRVQATVDSPGVCAPLGLTFWNLDSRITTRRVSNGSGRNLEDSSAFIRGPTSRFSLMRL